ncbi:Mg2+ and Co2+ transporter CorA [Collimonas sp. OK242]|uniref:CorA family divalent cation transporter n=1 Tax=Collimonas sp. OK242 TaxID=1798195 RepID=UPI000899ACCA|nr:CorA family divalent cation transporter [Collimonas sp. OK242]SDY56052.1 Mg2+ and Co2+ transporter CorA [Collimonas sp. OK242]
MLRRLSDVLNESTMGFLALASLSIGVAPLLFKLPHGIIQSFNIANWLIIGLFALEYGVNFMLSSNRYAFALEPWHLLDAAIVIAPLLFLIPAASHGARSTPALRILRLFRILLFGPRILRSLRPPSMLSPIAVADGKSQISILRSDATVRSKCGWDELRKWLAAPTNDWIHASNLSPEHLKAIALALGVSQITIETALLESSFPRIESGPIWTAFTISLPSAEEVTHRIPVLLLISENSILSLSRHPFDLRRLHMKASTLSWGPRCVLHIIGQVLTRHEELAGRMEQMVRQLEALPVIESPESFFRETFHLKRLLSTAKGDLWRLRGLLEMLADGRRQLPGLTPDQRASVVPLAEEAEYLYETIDNARESVLSLIELHLDIAAHDTNRFMRLLAIVTTLALIPAVIGGLLGMNLGEAPWSVTLGQVAFGTLVLTLGVLYTFMAKGWLR